MKTYENKEELKAEIKRAYDKYIAEFKDIPESLKDKQCMEVDRTPAENLAYQVGWTALVLKWENDEQAGLPVKTPSDGLLISTIPTQAIFSVCGIDIRVLDDELAEALKKLPERKRNTLLMYYFLEMTESEIANLQKITQSGVFRNRHHALETMKKILKEEH